MGKVWDKWLRQGVESCPTVLVFVLVGNRGSELVP